VQPPRAPRIAHRWNRPTGPVDDPWAWIRQRDDPATLAYIEAENDYSNAWFAQHAELVEQIFGEIKSRIQESDESAPVAHGPWWYVTRTEEGSSYPIHCRGASASGAGENVILDENIEAEGHEFFAVGLTEVSPDHRLLAYSVDTDGGERYTLKVRDLERGVDLDDRLTNTSWAGVAWAADNNTLFYVANDEAMRPFQVWRHRLGASQEDDTLVFHDDDERFFVGVETSRSGRFIIITSTSKTSSESLIIDANRPASDARQVRPRTPEVEYSVEHWGDRFVVLTNDQAEDFRLMTAPEAEPGAWTELVAHVSGRRVVSCEAFAHHLVVHEWADAQPRLRVLFRDGSERVIELGDEPHDVEPEQNPEWSATTFRFSYQSLTTPRTVYEENVVGGERTLLKRTPSPNLDLSQYVAHREWATAADGSKVPIDLLHRRDVAADGTAPAVIYAYGSYEASMPPWFSVARFSLIDRGVIWALAHPRGGGELGRRWYLEGKLLNKRNTFTDTIACTEHLVDTGWADPERLCVRGGSAGGLLVGACITMRPDLYASAVAEVPFVDVVNTMSDPSLPLTITEWEEWGDPRSEPYATYIASYSPYDNTVPGTYPALYVTAGLNDPRVSYHEPVKWVAKLREVAADDTLLLLRCEMGAGHAGPSGRYEAWRDEARLLTFIIATVR
jgi:oligopeptidase B